MKAIITSKEQKAFSKIKRIVLMAVGELKVELPIEETKLIDKLIKKNTPMKPLLQFDEKISDYDEIARFGLCPNQCTGIEFDSSIKYTHCCGQALDWSDE